VIKSDLGKIGG